MPEFISTWWLILSVSVFALVLWIIREKVEQKYEKKISQILAAQYHVTTVLWLYTNHLRGKFNYSDKDLEDVIVSYYGNNTKFMIEEMNKYVASLKEK